VENSSRCILFLTNHTYLLRLFHMTKQTQQLLLMLVIGVLLGTMGVKVFSGNRAEAPVTSSTPATTEENALSPVPSEERVAVSQKQFPLPPSVPENSRVGITVNNQFAAKFVSVDWVSVATSSWVAVYEEKEGKPDSILGAQKVKVGDTRAVVELLRPEGTLSGRKYFVAVLPDNGDGVFDRLTDLPPFSPDKVVIVSFLTQ
jgi:hypothetical protein